MQTLPKTHNNVIVHIHICIDQDYSLVFMNLLKEMLSKDERPSTR